jgi:hypothetical protein
MINNRFQVRQTTEELQELDKVLIALGYKKSDGTAARADWFRDMKRKAIQESEQKLKEENKK